MLNEICCRNFVRNGRVLLKFSTLLRVRVQGKVYMMVCSEVVPRSVLMITHSNQYKCSFYDLPDQYITYRDKFTHELGQEPWPYWQFKLYSSDSHIHPQVDSPDYQHDKKG